MSGIRATQGSTIVNSAGSAAPGLLSGLVTGTAVTLAVIGTTHTTCTWTLAGPLTSKAALDSATGATNTVTFSVAGDYSITVQGVGGTGGTATYVLPVSVAAAASTYHVGPLNIPVVAANAVVTPAPLTKTLFFDSADGLLKSKDSTGTVAAV